MRRMWEFFRRLMQMLFTCSYDFRGLSAKIIDGRNVTACGVRRQIIFPEADYDKMNRVRGFRISLSQLLLRRMMR